MTSFDARIKLGAKVGFAFSAPARRDLVSVNYSSQLLGKAEPRFTLIDSGTEEERGASRPTQMLCKM